MIGLTMSLLSVEKTGMVAQTFHAEDPDPAPLKRGNPRRHAPLSPTVIPRPEPHPFFIPVINPRPDGTPRITPVWQPVYPIPGQ